MSQDWSGEDKLIDTQWDVNDYVVSTMLDAYEINRYIVGCKLFVDENGNKAVFELIDTQWDVNRIIWMRQKQRRLN